MKRLLIFQLAINKRTAQVGIQKLSLSGICELASFSIALAAAGGASKGKGQAINV